MDMDNLKLSTETLREFNDDELTQVAGGAQVTIPPLTGNETYYCPTIGPTGITTPCIKTG